MAQALPAIGARSDVPRMGLVQVRKELTVQLSQRAHQEIVPLGQGMIAGELLVQMRMDRSLVVGAPVQRGAGESARMMEDGIGDRGHVHGEITVIDPGRPPERDKSPVTVREPVHSWHAIGQCAAMRFRATHQLIALFLSIAAHAQHRALPDGLYAGARLLSESDGPFTTERDQPLASYPFRHGLGPQLLYVKNLTGGLGWGVESGSWYFWNTDADQDELGRSFKRRAVVLPVLANVHMAVIRKPRFGLYLQASGGMAYTQTVHRYEGRSRVQQDTHGLYGITAILFIGLYRIRPLPDVFTGPHIGTSCFRIQGRPVRSVFIPMLLKAGWK